MFSLPYKPLIDIYVDASDADVTRNLDPVIGAPFTDVRVHKTDSSANTVTVTSRGVLLAEILNQNDFVTLRNHGTELRLLP